MTKEEYSQAADMVLYLCACALKQTVPDKERIAQTNLQQVYEVAVDHSLASQCAFALEAANIHEPSFTKAKGRAIRKTAVMEIDKNALCQRMEEEKIWYAPLKGLLLKDLYPAYGMRQMADFDILFDKNGAETVRDILVDLGFTVGHFGKGNQDVYYKKPVSNFEMHTELFSPDKSRSIYDYYHHAEDKLLPDENGGYARHFRHEDFYVYVITHAYRHYIGPGTGLRCLMDTYVWWKQYGQSMDTAYIRQETEKLGISEFEQQLRRLSEIIISEQPVPDDLKEMLSYLIDSGTYGKTENRVQHHLRRSGKKKYLLHRLFPPMDEIQTYYPFFYRHKLLLPALFFYRIGKAVTVGRKKTKKEWEQIRKNTEQETHT